MSQNTDKPALRFIVKSRIGVERHVPEPRSKNYVIISITSPGDVDASIPPDPRLHGVHRLSFVEPDEGNNAQREFTAAEAGGVWSFLSDYVDFVDTVVLHCDHGACRSPAIAAALSKWLIGDDSTFQSEYAVNPQIFKTLLETAPQRLKESRRSAEIARYSP